VMNNYWFTNFRTEQEGEFKWYYYLTSTADTSTATATRFGWNSRIPLVTRVLPPTKGKATSGAGVISGMAFPAPNLLVVEYRPAADLKGIILHVREIAGQPATLARKDIASATRIRRVDEVNVLEQPLQPKVDTVSFQPWESKFLRLSIK
jgi:alpha-mannosidase